MKKFFLPGILVTTLLAGTALPFTVQAAETSGESDQSARREQWKSLREQMRTEIKRQDADLQKLVTKMNNAPENEKADATSAVVNKLVQDRLALHQQMENMHEQMHNQIPNAGSARPSP